MTLVVTNLKQRINEVPLIWREVHTIILFNPLRSLLEFKFPK